MSKDTASTDLQAAAYWRNVARSDRSEINLALTKASEPTMVARREKNEVPLFRHRSSSNRSLSGMRRAWIVFSSRCAKIAMGRLGRERQNVVGNVTAAQIHMFIRMIDAGDLAPQYACVALVAHQTSNGRGDVGR
jgi:hypothetical protein